MINDVLYRCLSHFFLRQMVVFLSCWICFVTVGEEAKVPQLRPKYVDRQLINPNEDSTVSFVPLSASPAEKIEFQLLDYANKPVIQGHLTKGADGNYQTNVNLKRGYYEFKIPATQQRLGLLVTPPYTGKPDPFFGMGTCFSAVRAIFTAKAQKYPPERFLDECFSLLKRSGISSIREYNCWANAEKKENQMNWNFLYSKNIHDNGQKYAIKILDFFHLFPTWTCIDKRELIHEGWGNGSYYSHNPNKLERSFVDMAKRWAPVSCGFQIGNEPDGNTPSDSIMPALESVSYFFNKNKINIPVVAFGLTVNDHTAKFVKSYMQNGLMDYSDVIAFHIYTQNPWDVATVTKNYRTAMSGHPKAGMPIWVTECNRAWGETKSRPRSRVETDRDGAYCIAIRTAVAKACGVNKVMPFCLNTWGSGSSCFGLMDRRNSPMRTLAAYLTAVKELSGKEYIGNLKTLLDGVNNAMVFADGNNYCAVLTLKQAGRISLDGLPVRSVLDIDGREIPLDSQVNARNKMLYLYLDGEKASQLVSRDTPYKALLDIAKSYQPVPRKVSPVILQFERGGLKKKSSRYGYEIFPEKITFRANNLTEEPLLIKPELVVPAGVKHKALPENGMNFETGIKIPPKSFVTLNWAVDLKELKGFQAEITVRDQAKLASDLTVNFIDSAKYFDSNYVEKKDFALQDASRWRKNSTAMEQKFSLDSQENAMKFHAKFKEGIDYWLYPIYTLQADEVLDGAVAVTFEIKATQNVPKSCFYIYYKSDRRPKEINFSSPTTDWKKVTIKFRPGDFVGVDGFSIGMNPSIPEIAYWVKNVKFTYPIQSK